MQPSERNRRLNKASYDVLSIPGYVIKKKILHMEPDHGPSVRQYYKAHEMLMKAHKHKNGYKTMMNKYRKSLSDIVWTEEQDHCSKR